MDKDHLVLMLKSQPNSPSLHYKLGLWYRSRGQIKEAALYLEKALHYTRDQAHDASYRDIFDEPHGWLEYGKMMRLEGHIQQAEESFLQCLKLGKYVLESMVEWGAMMHDSGMCDADISYTLQSVSDNITHKLLTAHSLWVLGAYNEALLIYKSLTLSRDVWVEHLMPYVSCLIQTGECNEALSLLKQYSTESQHLLLKMGQQRIMASEALYVCSWCINRGQDVPLLSCFEALETAKTSIALGKVEEAIAMMNLPTNHEKNELIYTLYQHGYRDMASSMLEEMQELPLYDRNQISLDLCFIAAEIHYDFGDYQTAASIFESIFTTEPTHTPLPPLLQLPVTYSKRLHPLQLSKNIRSLAVTISLRSNNI